MAEPAAPSEEERVRRGLAAPQRLQLISPKAAARRGRKLWKSSVFRAMHFLALLKKHVTLPRGGGGGGEAVEVHLLRALRGVFRSTFERQYKQRCEQGAWSFCLPSAARRPWPA